MKEKRTVYARIFGRGIEAEWVRSESGNILLTSCLPAFITLVGVIMQALHPPRMKKICELLSNDIFINALQLSLIVCVFFVLFRSRRKLVLSDNNARRLGNYLREAAIIRDKGGDQIPEIIGEISKISKLFFYAWMAIWGVFLLYYTENLFAALLERYSFLICEETAFWKVKNFLDTALNFASSSAMYGVYVVLNTVIVSLNKENRLSRNGMEYSVALFVFFGCVTVLPSFFLFALCNHCYYDIQIWVSIVLSVYSVLSFVLMLGKFNNIRLMVPRPIYYGLYFYAILQAYQFLMMEDDAMNSFFFSEVIKYGIKTVSVFFQYATLVGKFLLSLMLLWIVDDFRFLFYLLKGNLEYSIHEYDKEEFLSYMKA